MWAWDIADSAVWLRLTVPTAAAIAQIANEVKPAVNRKYRFGFKWSPLPELRAQNCHLDYKGPRATLTLFSYGRAHCAFLAIFIPAHSGPPSQCDTLRRLEDIGGHFALPV